MNIDLMGSEGPEALIGFKAAIAADIDLKS